MFLVQNSLRTYKIILSVFLFRTVYFKDLKIKSNLLDLKHGVQGRRILESKKRD